MISPHPLQRFFDHQEVFILDGGLATTLEDQGHDLNDALWSARLLMDDPQAIREAHLRFLEAGADCLITSSYQASLPGFRRLGLSRAEGTELLSRSVDLAIEARELFWRRPENRRERQEPLVAASVGPYGAFLADGSEYRGNYGLDDAALRDFHGARWQCLAASQADLLACETLPSRQEAQVLLSLLEETPEVWAWLSFSCRDSARLNDGSRLVDAARDCDQHPRVAAVGINCTSPDHIPGLIDEARQGTDKPILVYPNLG